LFFLGSYIGNDEFPVEAMPSSMSCARVTNSSKDIGLMTRRI
jgi:hypothetical protein